MSSAYLPSNPPPPPFLLPSHPPPLPGPGAERGAGAPTRGIVGSRTPGCLRVHEPKPLPPGRQIEIEAVPCDGVPAQIDLRSGRTGVCVCVRMYQLWRNLFFTGSDGDVFVFRFSPERGGGGENGVSGGM